MFPFEQSNRPPGRAMPNIAEVVLSPICVRNLTELIRKSRLRCLGACIIDSALVDALLK